MRNLILAIFVLVFAVSCGPSTEIVKTWREPGATVNAAEPNKVLVIAMVKDETSRRVIEDELVKRIKTKSVVSYSILPPEVLKEGNDEVLNQKLSEGKFTHILMMRLADVEKDTYYVPGTTTGYYGGYGRFYGYGAGFYSDPGYYTTDKNYFVETTVFSVNPNKLIWTGTTKTVNPSKIEKTVNDIADVVADKMKSDGFLIK
jgi:hypothetical protein